MDLRTLKENSVPVGQLNNFRLALKFVLEHEGGYVNDPDDPGGETKWGISKRYHPDVDIKNLLPEQAAQIYAEEYWNPCNCDNIPHPYCAVVFDTAVNCGVNRAVQWLKLGLTPEDYIDTRRNFYFDRINRDPPKAKYLRGWMNRLNDLKKFVEVEQNKVL